VHTYATRAHWVGRFELTVRVRAGGEIEVTSTAEADDLSTRQAESP
jgi:hypothetical protein